MTVPKAFEKEFNIEPVTGKIIRVALYERVSSKGQVLKGGSLGDQHKVLTQ